MQQKVKARPVLNSHVIKMFARGSVLTELEQVSRIQKTLQDALDEFDGDYDEEELRLMRIKFISDVGN